MSDVWVQEGTQPEENPSRTIWMGALGDIQAGLGPQTGYFPLSSSIPSFSDWLASGAHFDENNPEQSYIGTFYTVPNHSKSTFEIFKPALIFASLVTAGAGLSAFTAAEAAVAPVGVVDVLPVAVGGQAETFALLPVADAFAAPAALDVLPLTGGLGETSLGLGLPGVEFVNPGLGGSSLLTSSALPFSFPSLDTASRALGTARTLLGLGAAAGAGVGSGAPVSRLSGPQDRLPVSVSDEPVSALVLVVALAAAGVLAYSMVR